MKNPICLPMLLLSLAACAAPASVVCAQAAPAPAPAQPGAKTDADSKATNRAAAYFHSAMADLYEEEAVNSGRPEYIQHAIDEYKYAINADPGSAALQDGLADLYF